MRLQAVKARIRQACVQAGRSPDEVTLLAVSKTQPAQAVRDAVAAGLHEFGENYVQEALDKMAALAEDRKSTRLNSSHIPLSRMPSSA